MFSRSIRFSSLTRKSRVFSLPFVALLSGAVFVPCALAQETASDAAATPVATSPSTTRTGPTPIVVNIDGRVSSPDPAPLLLKGAVYVPLRGVLENLGAKVEYSPAEKRIEITQNGQKYLLRPGIEGATRGTEMVSLAPAKIVAGRAFVPLRSLAELFGYRVAWLASQRTVAIYTDASQKPIYVDHRAELRAAGPFGVEIDFVDKTPEQIGVLLDKARQSGVGVIKTRFDWATLQPTRASEFQWTPYDTVVREARVRGLRLVGILGDSTQWASTAISTDPDSWRHSPPKEKELPAWSNYVKRVVGRYKVDVQSWQVWENPSALNFRSVAKNYRKLARAAVEAAREADANVILHAAEPGGVELDFIRDLTANGLTPSLDGVQVYPVSQWQPGVRNSAVNFVLPYATLRDKLQVSDGRTRDYWIGGVSVPAIESQGGAASDDQGLLSTFSPAAQADYLVQTFALGLAGGGEKVFWSALQDASESGSSARNATTMGTGLLRADGTQRPAFTAMQQVSAQLGGKPYAGNLALDRSAVALLFDDKKSGTLVVWSPDGEATLTLNASGTETQLPGAINVATRPDSLVTDATGNVVAPPQGVLKLGNRPIFISNVALKTAAAAGARLSDKDFRLSETGTSYAGREEITATFGQSGDEDGLFWRRFAQFGGAAREFAPYQGRTAIITEAQRDIFDLKSSRPFIYFDVADDFLYFAGGVPVTISVTVRRTEKQISSVGNSASSFRIEYDSPSGYKTTPIQVVESGTGWITYSFEVPDATFANAEGYDLLVNTGGSKSNLMFGAVSVKRSATSGKKAVS